MLVYVIEEKKTLVDIYVNLNLKIIPSLTLNPFFFFLTCMFRKSYEAIIFKLIKFLIGMLKIAFVELFT